MMERMSEGQLVIRFDNEIAHLDGIEACVRVLETWLGEESLG